MALDPGALEHVLITERERWLDGPPHELFGELRRGCPVHWTCASALAPAWAGLLLTLVARQNRSNPKQPTFRKAVRWNMHPAQLPRARRPIRMATLCK